ncbi:MAG: FAD-dependent oxidoreductase [Paracoccaceae bacterium]
MARGRPAAPVQHVLCHHDIHKYSVDFYKTLEAETGLNAGFAVVGNLRMAQTEARMDEYRLYSSVAETAEVYHEFPEPEGDRERWPLVRTDDLIGALFHPQDGYINPADVTMAMAKGARQRGVTIERKWQADAFEWKGDHWDVTLTKMVIARQTGGQRRAGVLSAEHVVTASGNHAQRTARMLGIKMPAIPVEHQFIVTEPDSGAGGPCQAGGAEIPACDADANGMSARSAAAGSLGPYERNARREPVMACWIRSAIDLFPARPGADRGGTCR